MRLTTGRFVGFLGRATCHDKVAKMENTVGDFSNLGAQLQVVAEGFCGHHGYRSLWLDPAGQLWHGEPEEDGFADLGHQYLGTFLRPSVEDLQEQLGRLLDMRPRLGVLRTPVTTAVAGGGDYPAAAPACYAVG